ncbi:MAG TPA: hypothetical protein DIW26_03620, partial [Ruminococcus sp.]|nr:hypothetical protein [Ruminococcus sp.]
LFNHNSAGDQWSPLQNKRKTPYFQLQNFIIELAFFNANPMVVICRGELCSPVRNSGKLERANTVRPYRIKGIFLF